MAGYVLVLDDDDLLRELMEEALSSEGYNVQCAASIAEALELARRQQPHFILFDLTLGSERGEEFVRAYRQLPEATAKLVATSAVTNLKQRAADLDVEAYLHKPWNLDDLLRLVRDAFSR